MLGSSEYIDGSRTVAFRVFGTFNGTHIYSEHWNLLGGWLLGSLGCVDAAGCRLFRTSCSDRRSILTVQGQLLFEFLVHFTGRISVRIIGIFL